MTASGPLGPHHHHLHIDEDEGLPPMDDTQAHATTLPPPDEVLVLPHFEERLLAVLRDRQAAGAWSPGAARGAHAPPRGAANPGPSAVGLADEPAVAPAPDGLDQGPPDAADAGPARHRAGAPEPGRRRGAVPGRRRRALAAAAALVVLAGAAIVAVRSGGSDRPDVGTAADAPPDDPRDPIVRQRILLALTEALATSVVHTTVVGRSEQWSDLTSRAERVLTLDADGRPLVDMGRSVAPDPDDQPVSSAEDGPPSLVPSRFVDHCLGEYADRPQPYLFVGSPIDSLGDALVDGGSGVLDGTEVVDGRELLRLVGGDPTVDAALDAAREEYEQRGEDVTIEEPPQPVTYLDPETRLPVLRIGPDGSRTEFEFLPRTPESLALVVPPVPGGFTRVETPALDEERAAGCR